MKRHRITFGLLLLLAGSVLLGSCIKENKGETIALIGTEYYIDDIISVIPDTLQGKFNTLFGGYHQGAVPDKLEGSYVVNPNLLKSTNLQIPTPRLDPDVNLRFSWQNNGTMVVELYQESTVQITNPVFVMGSDKEFTVYFVEEKSIETGAWMKRGVVISGRLTDSGLANFRMAFVILESEGELAPAPGSYYYYEDGDAMARNCDWPL